MKRIFVFLLITCIACPFFSQNPFLPPYAFIPDGEPHVFSVDGEERLFIYGSRDERVTAYCGYGHDLWSAPVNNLSEWTFHGEIFNVQQVKEIGYGKVNEQHFGAPDCVYNPVTKKYYLYTFLGAAYKLDGVQGPERKTVNYSETFGDYGPNCVMAESDTPYGPFVNPVMCDWEVDNAARTFDPSVIVVSQPDGSVRVWAYWGMRRGDRWAELDPNDMHTVINSFSRKPDRKSTYKTLNNPLLNNNITLFEASSIKQVDSDKFVFIFSPNRKYSALSYCYSNSPEGPWKYGGVIIDNSIGWKGGNNHGSIVKVGDQWYVVYHRQSPNNFNRQAMIEPIDLKIEKDKVVISRVEMTSQGILKEGLPYEKRYYAGIACYIKGDAYVDGTRRLPDGYNPIVVGKDGATLGYKYFNFSGASKGSLKFRLNAKSAAPFKVELEVESKDKAKRFMIGSRTIFPSKGSVESFKDYSIPVRVADISDSMALYISVKSDSDKVEIKEIEFKR